MGKKTEAEFTRAIAALQDANGEPEAVLDVLKRLEAGEFRRPASSTPTAELLPAPAPYATPALTQVFERGRPMWAVRAEVPDVPTDNIQTALQASAEEAVASWNNAMARFPISVAELRDPLDAAIAELRGRESADFRSVALPLLEGLVARMPAK